MIQPLDRRDSLLVVYGVYLVCFALVPAVFIVIFGTVNWVSETNSSRDENESNTNLLAEGPHLVSVTSLVHHCRTAAKQKAKANSTTRTGNDAQEIQPFSLQT